MLQLYVSSSTNSSAVYPDIPAPAGLTQVALDFTQSYDYSTKANVIATLINTPSATNPWLVFQVSGSTLPTASGQYNVDIYQFTQASNLLTWITQNTLWNATANTWAGGDNVIKGALLSSERAFISGSNGVDTTTYLLPANGGKYTTYNHP